MGHTSFVCIVVATMAIVALVANLTTTMEIQTTTTTHRHTSRALQSGDVIRHYERTNLIEALTTHNNETTERLSVAAHSYCHDHGNNNDDLEEYPLPRYDACSPYSTLNIIPFFGGMSNALKFILLGALLSFEEGRCFHVSEQNAQLHPGFNNHKEEEDGRTPEEESFIHHFFEGIGLPANHSFVQERLASGNYEVRGWKSYWGDLKKRRTITRTYNFTTLQYSHPVANVNGVELKRDALRHVWHLQPHYRDSTCRALQEADIYDTDYIALSIRRGDKRKEKHFQPPTMAKYIEQAERVIPYMFPSDQAAITPKLFVATDDCTVLPILRKARPQWLFISECDKLSEPQTGYDINDIPKMNEEQREEHFRKFFIELYAMSLSKVFIGVSYTNVAWFVYMMRPNVDQATFVLLDKIGLQDRTISRW